MSEPLFARSFISDEDHLSALPQCYPEINFLDENCLVVYAGFYNQNFIGMSDGDIIKFREKILIGHTSTRKYYFDCILEGVVVPVIDVIHKIIDGYIESGNVFYFTAALNGNEIYNDYVTENNIKNPITVLCCNAWEEMTYPLEQKPYNIRLKDKKFLSFNRVVRPHRTALLGLLEDRKLREKGYYSFLGTSHSGDNFTLDTMLIQLYHCMTEKSRAVIRINLNKLLPSLPLKLNIDPNENVTSLIESDQTYFDNSYFSVVTETIFFPVFQDEKAIFFSEKIFKPIMMKHPFILLGSAGSLEYLRKERYKTFHPYIDETYDTIEDHEGRMYAIVDEIERLSKLSNEEWIDWQQKIKHIVEFNYRTLMYKRKYKWKK